MNERTAHQAMDEAADWAMKHRAQTHRVLQFPVRQKAETSWLAGMYRDTVTMWSPPFRFIGRYVNWWFVLGLSMVILAWPIAGIVYLIAQYIAGQL